MSQLSLQFWDAKTKMYVPCGAPIEPERKLIEAAVDAARTSGYPWRIAKIERPLKNPKHTPPRGSSTGRTIADVQRDYLTWAQAKGLTSIVAYSTKPPPKFAADKLIPLFSGEITYTTPDQQFAVEETTDMEQAA